MMPSDEPIVGRPIVELSDSERDLLTIIVELGSPDREEALHYLDDSYPEQITDGRFDQRITDLVDKGYLIKIEDRGQAVKFIPSEKGRQSFLADLSWRNDALGSGFLRKNDVRHQD